MYITPGIRLFVLGCMAFAASGTARAGVAVEADDSKNEKKAMVEQPDEKWWSFYADTGYDSKYIFRGNDLTHDSDGIIHEEIRYSADVPKVGLFEIGLYSIQMLGEGQSSGVFLDKQTNETVFIQTQGPTKPLAPADPETLREFFKTTLTRFNEYDIYERYTRSFGPVKVTLGSVLFLVDSRSVTEGVITDLNNPVSGSRFPFGSIKDVNPASILRPFISLSLDPIMHVVPSLTYYENALRHRGGDGNVKAGAEGYMEGKLDGSFHLFDYGSIKVSAEPYARVSYSFRDRSHLGILNIGDIQSFQSPKVNNDFYRYVYAQNFQLQADTLYTGFQHFQSGVQLPVQFNKFVAFIPSVSYVHLFSLVPGDRRDTYVAGAQVALSF